MNSEEDPEARIRELEQPMADRARASELGSDVDGGYSYPPPPPGPVPPPVSAPMSPNYAPPSYSNYNNPYPGGTPRSSSGIRLFWILAAVAVIGGLVIVAGVAAYVARQFSEAESAITSTNETTTAVTSVTAAPGSNEPPTGKTRVPSSASSPAPTAPAGEQVIISGINEKRTVSCNGNAITVSGISNTVTLTGHCGSVTVSGLQNVVTVDTADTIEASGLDNRVTYHSGAPKINKSGGNNTVEQG